MPIYEYACAACGHEFEEWQKMSDAPVRTCPKCKKKKVERLISKTAFQLKGSGWYADLYASAKPGQDAKGEKAEKAEKSEKAESTDSSSKPESAGGDKGSSAKGAEKAKSSDASSSSSSKKKAAKKAESRAA